MAGKHRKSPQWGQSQPCIVVLFGLPLFLCMGIWRALTANNYSVKLDRDSE